jgi:APA family basic amino acid/polyamine antiporter
VGETIGSGILRTPGEVAAHLGRHAFILAAWIIGGVYAFLCTLAVTELGTMLRLAGRLVCLLSPAFGEDGGFVTGGSDFIVQAASSAYLAVAFGAKVAGSHGMLCHLQATFRWTILKAHRVNPSDPALAGNHWHRP